MKHLKPNLALFLFKFKALCVVGMMLAGCGSADAPGTSDSASGENGELIVSLTDAAGDFAAYNVDVLAVNLTHASGAQVSALPQSARIDFAQYTDMTEFLTAATVPAGAYVSVSLVLNYENAEILAEDEIGNIVPVEAILDEDGLPVTTLEVSVRLEDKNRLVIAPGMPAHLMLDFDLHASNEVGFDGPDNPTLTIDPFLVADVNRTPSSKIHRLRGLLDGVDLEAGSFSVMLRPFYAPLSDRHRRFGICSVVTDENTLFDINDSRYEGETGLNALEALDRLTPVVALGDLAFNPLRFESREVYAGSSVPGSVLDAVNGNVIKRSGDTLILKRANMMRPNSSVAFLDEVTVSISDATRVTKQFSNESFTKEDISVGQRLTVFGTVTDTDSQALELDASEGAARMLLTTVRGVVVAADPSNPVAQLTLNLQSIDRHRVGSFDFTGSGITEEKDADPSSYDVFTGTLDISSLSYGFPVQFRGFPEPYGQAPPDFNARTLIDVVDLTGYLKVAWRPATQTPFESITGTDLALNLDGVSREHHLIQGGAITDCSRCPMRLFSCRMMMGKVCIFSGITA